MTTSRIGRKPVVIPAGVVVTMKDLTMSVKGPKGTLSIALHPYVNVTMEDNQIMVHKSTETEIITGAAKKLYKSIAGTVRSNIFNVIHGVTEGFERKLQLVGVGYRAQLSGKKLALSLGFSHPTEFTVPEGITIETPTQTEIVIKGANKEQVGLVASKIRKIRSPEPYKGKGVRYSNEVIVIKETKKK
jgi:large subunit ribosomal protein L6